MRSFISDIGLEFSLLTRRTSARVIVVLWLIMGLFFNYFLEYISFRTGTSTDPDGGITTTVDKMIPATVVGTTTSGYAFFGGALVLILAVLTFGNEFNWNMWKTLFTQRPSRTHIILAKLGALALVIVPMVVLATAVNGVASVVIAQMEDAPMNWPSFGTFMEAFGAGWLILMAWAAFGVLLAVLTRGTGLAIGLGILWALVIEGLLSGFGNSIDWMRPAVEGLIRANAYSLTRSFGGGTVDGPGLFNGPFVSVPQAIAVLSVWLVVCSGLSLWLMRRRDVA